MSRTAGPVSAFIDRHFLHFNAATLIDAANAYHQHLESGGKMLVTLAGAMSTAELGISLAEMIRAGKVHGICCTGANLEEDVFNLVAHDHYERVPHYRDLTAARRAGAARPAPQPRHRHLHPRGRGDAAHRARRAAGMAGGGRARRAAISRTSSCTGCCGRRCSSRSIEIDPRDSWLLAACEKNLPIFVPGWEDSTLGNIFAAHGIAGKFKSVQTMRSGVEYMMALADWYRRTAPARVDRLLPDRRRHRRRLPDLRRADAAAGSEDAGRAALGLLLPDQRFDDELRLVLGRRAEREDHLGQARRVDTPKFIIESDATIVAPLMFAQDPRLVAPRHIFPTASGSIRRAARACAPAVGARASPARSCSRARAVSVR